MTLNGWEKLGSTKLTVAGDTITVSGMTAKKHLKIIYHLIGHTDVVNFDAGIQFNSDTGSNYAWRESSNGVADTTSTSTTRFMTGAGYIGSGEVVEGVYNVINISSEEKLGIGEINENNASGAGNAPNRREAVGKWANTTNQITSIQIIKHSGTGSYAADSEVVVWGTDDTSSGLPSNVPTNTVAIDTIGKKYYWKQAVGWLAGA